MPSPAHSLCVASCVVTLMAGCATDHASLLMRQAVDAHERGDHALAARGYRDALRMDPSARGAYQNLSLLAALAGRLEDARALAHLETRHHPEALASRLNAAALSLRAGRPEEASAALAPLGSRAPLPLRIGVHHVRAQLALTEGAYEAALKALAEALAVAGGVQRGLQLDRALVLAHMGQAERARTLIERVLSGQAKDPRGLKLQGLLAR